MQLNLYHLSKICEVKTESVIDSHLMEKLLGLDLQIDMNPLFLVMGSLSWVPPGGL